MPELGRWSCVESLRRQFAGRRVLVTGASGFIGSALVEAAAQLGARVHGICHAGTASSRVAGILGSSAIHTGDIGERSFVEGVFAAVSPSVVLHCAAHGSNQQQTDPDAIVATNVSGTLHLLECASQGRVEAFVYTGTSSEYGRSARAAREDDVLRPMSLYAITKAAGTHSCQWYAKSREVPAVAIRLYTVFGPSMERQRLIPTAIRAALRGEVLRLTGSRVTHDFVYIDDVVRALLMAACRPDLKGEIFNVCSGAATENGEIAGLVAEVSGRPLSIERGAYATHTWDTEFWCGDGTQAAERLGWTPEVDLREGLRRTIEWVRSWEA